MILLLMAAGCGGSTGDSSSEAAAPATATPSAAPTETPAATPPPTSVATAVPVATGVPVAAALPDPIELVVFDNDFAESVAPIFADKCASCHNAGGPGAIHWQLDTAGDLAENHEWISTVVSSRYMPPWPASDLSLVFHDNRSLRADEIDAIAAWSAAGAPVDVAETTPIVSPQGVVALDADVEIGPHEPFQGSTTVADDYRCLIYDLELTEQRWLQGFEFVPDQAQIVHHAIGYLASGEAMARARRLSEADELGGWQCYGGSGIDQGDDLFLGWAPGQLPTQFPVGSGIVAEPGDFIIMQIHYHFDAEAPADASTIRLDWADGTDLDPIEFAEFIGPAEIPCASTETGPLCDRDAARARAYARYGVEGVLADGINSVCGVRPQDFAEMTSGIASSACTIQVRDFGEIVSVFGHEHEIGKSIRMTLNAGQPDEQILLDIPDWSFDWQYNYYPVESVMLERGDTVLLECSWDRSRRSPDLEPAYVLWADGTNDEMCFATISTRLTGEQSTAGGSDEVVRPFPEALAFDIPEEIAACMADAGVPLDQMPTRDMVDIVLNQLYFCSDPVEVGQLLTGLIKANFGGLVNEDGLACLSDGLSHTLMARRLLIFGLEDSTEDERRPIGELVGDCVSLSAAVEAFGFPLPDAAKACVDEGGRELLVQATIDGELPEEQTLFAVLNPCLAGG